MLTLSTSGYAIVPQLLSSTECDALIEALESANLGRAGARHLMALKPINALAYDERLRALAGGAIPFRATLFNKTSKANWLIPWHQDTALPLTRRFDDPEWGPWSQKSRIWYAHAPQALQQILALRIHLDASTPQNGPLRVIPGSGSRCRSRGEHPIDRRLCGAAGWRDRNAAIDPARFLQSRK